MLEFYGIMFVLLFLLSALSLMDLDYKMVIITSAILEYGLSKIFRQLWKFFYFQIYARLNGLSKMNYLISNNMKDILQSNWMEQFLFLKTGIR